MRVLHVTDSTVLRPGGAELAIDPLVRAMERLELHGSVLAQKPRGSREPFDTPYPLQRFSDPRSPQWAGWWIRWHIRRLERRTGAFDLYIGHHAFAPGYACVRHSRRVDRPAIVHLGSGDLHDAGRFRKRRSTWVKRTWALANAAAVVCANRAMEESVRQIIGISAAEGRIVRIPDGVDLDALNADASAAPLPARAALNGPFILALGRVVRRKGLHLLIEAFSRMRAREFKLVIAGDGRDRAALQAQAAGLGSRVLFTGSVRDQDKRWLLQNCQFLVAPSTQPSVGRSALEAMACGRPVVALQAGGLEDLIRHGESGLIVDRVDTSAVTDALDTLAGPDATAMGRAARLRAEEYSWANIAKKYRELIERVRHEWGGSPG